MRMTLIQNLPRLTVLLHICGISWDSCTDDLHLIMSCYPPWHC